MTVTSSSPIVGIFKDRSMAEQAIEALHSAGFPSELIRYSAPGASSSILADLKSLFTGQNVTGDNVVNDLIDMGLSNEDAQYYSNAYRDGNTILAVSASARAQEVGNILHQYGAVSTSTTASMPTSTETQNAQSAVSPADQTLEDESTQPLASGYYSTPQGTSSDDATPEAASATQDVSSNSLAENDALSAPSDSAVSDYNSASETVPSSSTPPDVISETQTTPYDAETYDAPSLPQGTGSDVTSSDPATSEPQAQAFDPVISDAAVVPEDTQSNVPLSDRVTSDTMTSDPTLEPQDTRSTLPSTEDGTPYIAQAPISDTEVASAPPQSITASEHNNELQQLLAQLQEAQQQLQDAKAQLQAAKEHETYVQTSRERERQLQEARQQLQDLQAQLQATLAELHETQGRISQYQ